MRSGWGQTGRALGCTGRQMRYHRWDVDGRCQVSEQLLVQNLSVRARAHPGDRYRRSGWPMETGARSMLGQAPTAERQTLAERLADDRPEADFDWEPVRISMISQPVDS